MKEEMGMFGDRDVMNSFDSLFDYDRDGTLNVMESTMQMEFLSENERRSSYDLDDDDDFDDDFDDGF